jgi:hypothetical protein
MTDYDWPAPTADTIRAGLLATRKADEAERFARLLATSDGVYVLTEQGVECDRCYGVAGLSGALPPIPYRVGGVA